MDKKKVIARIEQLRIEKGISVYQLKENADISSTIYQWKKNATRDSIFHDFSYNLPSFLKPAGRRMPGGFRCCRH